MVAGLSDADLAHLARCAWQRQQGALDRDRAQREFTTVALWNAAGCRRARGSGPSQTCGLA